MRLTFSNMSRFDKCLSDERLGDFGEETIERKNGLMEYALSWNRKDINIVLKLNMNLQLQISLLGTCS